MKNEIVLKKFKNPELNQIGSKLIELDEEYARRMRKAKKSLFSAFKTRWQYGKIISENIDKILDECGTQKAFAKKIGESEAVVSNNKRAYEYLKEHGCDTWDQVTQTLKQKQIKPTVSNLERIGTLLNEPDKKTSKKAQIEKDRRRLEQLRGEIEEILTRNEPLEKPDIIKDAFEFKEDIDEVEEYLDSFDPKKTDWRSEKYLAFVRKFGYDIITGEPQERCDPHHIDPETGGTGPSGTKLPDTFTIPVSRETHRMLHNNKLEPTTEQLQSALITTLTRFIQTNLK